MAKTIYVINGPNLNLLGTREPHIYGRSTLKDVEKLCRKTAEAHGYAVEFRQSNHEGVIVDWIQEAGARKAHIATVRLGAFTKPKTNCSMSMMLLNCVVAYAATIEIRMPTTVVTRPTHR